VKRADDLGIEAGANHQQEELSAGAPQVEAYCDPFVQRATNGRRIRCLLHKPPQQVFSAHRHWQ
jgi:hypothetical protein